MAAVEATEVAIKIVDIDHRTRLTLPNNYKVQNLHSISSQDQDTIFPWHSLIM